MPQQNQDGQDAPPQHMQTMQGSPQALAQLQQAAVPPHPHRQNAWQQQGPQGPQEVPSGGLDDPRLTERRDRCDMSRRDLTSVLSALSCMPTVVTRHDKPATPPSPSRQSSQQQPLSQGQSLQPQHAQIMQWKLQEQATAERTQQQGSQ